MKYFSLVILCLFVIGCGSTNSAKNDTSFTQQVAQAKTELKECLDSAGANGENCVSKERADKLGFKCQIRQTTGTRLGKRVCTTAKQREDLAKASREAARGIQRSVRSPPTGETAWHNGY